MKITQSKLLNNFKNTTSFFTTRASGNLAFHVDDNYENVLLNHQHLASELNYDKKTLVHMKQIHSDIVLAIDDNDNFENPPTCDALITDKLNTPLMVMVADCSPILFYDHEQRVIAVAHAGRQGAFKNIVKNVIDSFIDNYSSNPKNIYVSIGASIGRCCYEVGSEVYEEVKLLDLEYAIEKREKSYYLDIGKILKTQLLSCRIDEKNIEISKECSCCLSDKYFSYRTDRDTGRFCGVIILK